MNDDGYLSPKQVAAILNLSERTIRDLRRKGVLEFVRLSERRIGFTRDAVARYVASLNQK